MPVARLGKFLFNDISDQEYLAAAQKFADHEGSEGGNEYHSNAADDARYGQRESDLEKGLYIVRAQVFRRIYHIGVDFHEGIINGQHHKRQKVIYHAKNDRIGRIDNI